MEAGSAALRVDWPVYPRRAEHNTVAEGGNRRWAETARQSGFQSRWPRADAVKAAAPAVRPTTPPRKRVGAPQTDDGSQSVMVTDPLGLGNWQITQRTAFSLHNRTGSDVFIAASTMAS